MHVINDIENKRQKRLGHLALTILMGLAAAVAIILWLAPPVMAADKGGPKVEASDVPYMPPAAKGWSGCGVGAYIGHAAALADLPGPVGIGAVGNSADGQLYCDAAFGVFVLGVFADYAKVWDDLHTIGVNTDIRVGGRAGFVALNSLLYTHVEWERVDGSGFHINGLGVGGGIEVKLPGAPFFVDLRYTHSMFDNVMGSGINVSSDEARVGLKYKFSSSGR